MAEARLANCSNTIEREDFTYIPCTGTLTFEPGDRDAACDTCDARCGVLVADYQDGAGPTEEAQRAFEWAVHLDWVRDHTAGHPNGRGNCPFCCPPRNLADVVGQGIPADRVMLIMDEGLMLPLVEPESLEKLRRQARR